jgi:CspA family cold shock protein
LETAGISSVDEGDKVTFDIEDDQRGRGKQATNVQLAQ